MNNFIIYALPRSRTKWLSKFLTYDKWVCHHDLAVESPSIPSLIEIFMTPYSGTCETGMVDAWRLIRQFQMKTIVIKRDINDVRKSLLRFGIVDDEALERRNALLNEVEADLVIDFKDIDDRAKEIFELCLETPFDSQWFESLKDKNIQIDMNQRLQKLRENREHIELMKHQVSLMA